jgi:murein DD-endopeptidase MepM/ murein hydrolase activator NlpD
MRLRQQHPKNSFGMVRKKKDGTPKPHQGWDLAAPAGTSVYAIAEGEIIATTDDVGDMAGP